MDFLIIAKERNEKYGIFSHTHTHFNFEYNIFKVKFITCLLYKT